MLAKIFLCSARQYRFPMKAKKKHFPFKHLFVPHRIRDKNQFFSQTSCHKIVKITNVVHIACFVENNITQVCSQALFMSGASKFHTWKISWFELLIYFFCHTWQRGAVCVTNTRVTEYSVYHLFLLLLSSRSILGVRRKIASV